MKTKSMLIFTLGFFLCSALSAQEVVSNEQSCNIETIQSAVDACLMFASSVEANDTTAIRLAKEAMQACKLSNFGSLRQQNAEENESLNGHLVFNVAFADSLVHGSNPYEDADNINRRGISRGQMKSGQILTKTCFVKANGKSEYLFTSHDLQELAVVAEPGGLVTIRVHATNENGINEWHNDTVDVARGQNSRKTAFILPHSPRSKVMLEITNCTNKDISVVVISN